jgi:hypothetical protein
VFPEPIETLVPKLPVVVEEFGCFAQRVGVEA